jgi:integrase
MVSGSTLARLGPTRYPKITEIDRLLAAAKDNRHGVRDSLLLLMMYRHGLRVTEAIKLRLDALNLKQSSLWVKRIKNSLSTQQPIPGDELRAIKRYLATRSDRLPWLFALFVKSSIGAISSLGSSHQAKPSRLLACSLVESTSQRHATESNFRKHWGASGDRQPVAYRTL